MSIKYAISSNTLYFKKVLPKLLFSMKCSGVQSKSIVVVIGGCEKEQSDIVMGVTMKYVKHNSFDYTAMIEMSTQQDCEKVLFIHDTCSVGAHFRDLVESQDMGNSKILVPTTAFPGICNIGIYDMDFIWKCRAIIENLKNCDKKKAVESEAFLVRLPISKTGYFKNATAHPVADLEKPTKIYSDGVLRITEYYPAMDLYKYKANWSPKENWTIGV